MGTVGKLGQDPGSERPDAEPETGQRSMDVTSAVKAAKGGSVEFALRRKASSVGVGKASFDEKKPVKHPHRWTRL